MHLHHRQSEADGIVDPVPGLLAGGPNPDRQDGCSGYIGTEPARSYADVFCSYAFNENAINWNAALVYLAGAIEAIQSSTGRPNITSIQDDFESRKSQQRRFGLLQNHPNPFNPKTHIHYTLPESADVHLGVYNMTGQLVRTLESAQIKRGHHEVIWHADTDSGMRAPTGLYIARLVVHANGKTTVDSKKMLMLK